MLLNADYNRDIVKPLPAAPLDETRVCRVPAYFSLPYVHQVIPVAASVPRYTQLATPPSPPPSLLPASPTLPHACPHRLTAMMMGLPAAGSRAPYTFCSILDEKNMMKKGNLIT